MSEDRLPEHRPVSEPPGKGDGEGVQGWNGRGRVSFAQMEVCRCECVNPGWGTSLQPLQLMEGFIKKNEQEGWTVSNAQW